MDSQSLALFSLKSKHELLLSEKLFWLTIRNRGGAVVFFYTFRGSVSVMVMKFSPWFFWSVYSSCSTIPQHVWMRIWHKISLMFWVSLNACSNVFFCLFTKRVLDLKAINQTLFHTLNMSPAFPAEEVRASWFQVRRKQHFFFLASLTYYCLIQRSTTGRWRDSHVFFNTGPPSNFSGYLPVYNSYHPLYFLVICNSREW